MVKFHPSAANKDTTLSMEKEGEGYWGAGRGTITRDSLERKGPKKKAGAYTHVMADWQRTRRALEKKERNSIEQRGGSAQ